MEPLKRANLLAMLALFASVTAALLPWWVLESSYQGVAGELVPPVGLWGPDAQVAKAAYVWLSLGLLALAVVLLFVRVAAASWRHEPASLRRDLLVAAALLAGALAAAWAWPVEFPFWGSRGYALDQTGEPVVVAGQPGLGWWLALAAALACVGAWASSRRPKA